MRKSPRKRSVVISGLYYKTITIVSDDRK
jgi:hypothetical protein